MANRFDRPGAYILTNLATGEFYVGSSADLRTREQEHRWRIQVGTHGNRRIRENWINGHDIMFESFPTKSREEAFDKEQSMLNEFADNPSLVNIAINARTSSTGLARPESVKQAIREKLIGRKRAVEIGEKISASKKGMVFSEEHKRNLKINHHASKRVLVFGVEYASRADAAKSIGMPITTLNRRLRSDNDDYQTLE